MEFFLIRLAFGTLALLFGVVYGIYWYQLDPSWKALVLPPLISLLLIVLSLYIGSFFKKTSLKWFNVTMLGLFFGFLFAKTVYLFIESVASLFPVDIPFELILMGKTALFLVCGYLGMALTWQASDEWAISIPFIRLIPTEESKKDFLVDGSALEDPRFVSLAASGLVDSHLLLPRFLLPVMHESEERKKGLEMIRQLEELPHLHLRYVDQDFPDMSDPVDKLMHLARLLDAKIITSDPSRVYSGLCEGVHFININTLANTLKPMLLKGELLSLTIQRYGKEPRQGIGYLDDGTMVVVNGGADYLGQTVEVTVLSIKHTTAGRIIFCNTKELESKQQAQVAAKSYFAV